MMDPRAWLSKLYAPTGFSLVCKKLYSIQFMMGNFHMGDIWYSVTFGLKPGHDRDVFVHWTTTLHRNSFPGMSENSYNAKLCYKLKSIQSWKCLWFSNVIYIHFSLVKPPVLAIFKTPPIPNIYANKLVLREVFIFVICIERAQGKEKQASCLHVLAVSPLKKLKENTRRTENGIALLYFSAKVWSSMAHSVNKA